MNNEVASIFLVLCGIGVFAILYAWYFVFGRSSKAVLLAVLGALLGRTDTVDPDAPIEVPPSDQTLRSALTERSRNMPFEPQSTVSAQGAPSSTQDLPRAPVPPEEPGHRTTSDSGWPVVLDPKTRNLPRPFRFIRLGSGRQDRTTSDKEGDN